MGFSSGGGGEAARLHVAVFAFPTFPECWRPPGKSHVSSVRYVCLSMHLFVHSKLCLNALTIAMKRDSVNVMTLNFKVPLLLSHGMLYTVCYRPYGALCTQYISTPGLD